MSDSPQQPEASFLTLVYTLGTQAMIALGEIPNPMSQELQVDRRQAQWHIDTLQILSEKTSGNLTDEEATAMINVLGELKMKFVEKTPDDGADPDGPENHDQ